ncbi:MAG: hypothetical protein WBD38_08015 [Candidatus Dormiibacterota bacterium]
MTFLGAAAPATAFLSTAAPTAAQQTADRSGCPGGMVLENANGRSGIPECRRPGSPEGPGELGVAEQQRASIYRAGTGDAPAGTYANAVAQMNALPNAAGGASGWALQGKGPLDASQPYDAVGSPFPQTIADLGLKHLTGRITDLAYDPAAVWNGKRIFASGAEGGVWETRDGGQSWRSIGDRLITQSVGAIAWVPGAPAGGDDGTLVVGTGDNAQGRYNYTGHGIFFTNDDGNTWLSPSPNVVDPSQNFRIRVSPGDPHRLYAATSKGLWQGNFLPDFSALSFRNLVLPVTPSGYGANCDGTSAAFPCFLANNVTDVEVRTPTAGTTTPDVVVASVGSRFGNRPYDSNQAFKQTPKAGIYKSASCGSILCPFGYITPVGVCTTAPVNDQCFPTTDHVGRVSLAAAHGTGQNFDSLFAVIQDPVKENACFDDLDLPTTCLPSQTDPVLGLPIAGGNLGTVLDGMYYSTDFGATWLKVMDWSQLNFFGTNSAIGGAGTGQAAFGYGPGIQSSYNNWVIVDPTSTGANGKPTRLLFGLEEVWATNPLNGGTLSGALNPSTTGWRSQANTVGEPPWVAIGRYWSACGPFTFGTGINCNSLINAGLGGSQSTTHPDQHAALFVPGQPDLNFFAGGDGGISLQTVNAGHPNFDNNSWGLGVNNNMNVLQPYNAEISKDGTIVAGLQDNGEMKINPTTGKMDEIFGGDGLMSGIDPDNSQNIIECYVHAICSFTNDGGLNWTRIDPGVTDPRFDAPLQMDPKDAKHYMTGGRQVVERIYGYNSAPCVPAVPADPQCTIFASQAKEWTPVYDLGTADHPGDSSQPDTNTGPNSDNSASAIDLNGANAYVGFCGLCDVSLEGIPFVNGIATNVGGSKPPSQTTTDGWHIAAANGLPRRYITSVRMDPTNVNTIFVTLGGYQRVWVPPGAFGEPVDARGGHVFKSTDHGEHFTDVSGNLPNTPALWSVIHNGQLIVATDIGVFQSGNTSGAAYSTLGTLPATPVDTIRIAPGNPDLMVAALWGRGVWAYCFTGAVCPSNIFTNNGPLPNTAEARSMATWLWVAGLALFALAAAAARRLYRRKGLDLA